MLNITITESTPANMLRAIRAACNELLGETHADLTTQAAEHVTRANELQAAADAEAHKAAACLTGWNAGNTAVPGDFSEELAASEADSIVVTSAGANDIRVENGVTIQVLTDSTGAEWSPELHASTKSKNADGTWKKRRNAGSNQAAQAQETAGAVDTVDVSTIQDHPGSVINVGLGAVPPVPPAPAEPIMPKIFALITSQIVTINQAVEAAQAEGYADLGANGLGGAPREAQEAVLRKLEG